MRRLDERPERVKEGTNCLGVELILKAQISEGENAAVVGGVLTAANSRMRSSSLAYLPKAGSVTANAAGLGRFPNPNPAAGHKIPVDMAILGVICVAEAFEVFQVSKSRPGEPGGSFRREKADNRSNDS